MRPAASNLAAGLFFIVRRNSFVNGNEKHMIL